MVLHKLMRYLAVFSVAFGLAVVGPAFAQETGAERPDVFTTLPWSWTGQQKFTSTIHGVSTQTGQTYTLVPGDCSRPINFTNNSTITATVPSTMPAGCDVFFVQLGTGQVTVVAGSGATFRPNPHGFTGSSGQNSVSGIHVDSNSNGTSAAFEFVSDGPGSTPSNPPPAPAAAAGFTTLALHSDFTVTMPQNWLGGCSVAGNGAPNNTNDSTGHFWYNNVWWAFTYQNCNTKQITDPVFGGTVVDVPWNEDDSAENVGAQLTSSGWFATDQINTFPNNAYYQLIFRMTPVQPGTWGGIFTWPLQGMTVNGYNGMEADDIELDSGCQGCSDANLHNWADGNGPFIWLGWPNGLDPTQYHKFGLTTISDGITLQACSYVDDVPFGTCQPLPGGFLAANAIERNFLILINACDFWNYNVACSAIPGGGGPGQTHHLYAKDIQVWSCANWRTTQCIPGPANGPNQLSNSWVSVGVTQSATVAPDGVTPAIKITEDTSTGPHVIQQTLAGASVKTSFGFNIAPGTGTGTSWGAIAVCLGVSGSNCADAVIAIINPTTGLITAGFDSGPNDQLMAGSSAPIPGNCSPAPNCGFRVWITYLMPASANQTAVIFTKNNGGAGDGSSSFSVWGWALETGVNEP